MFLPTHTEVLRIKYLPRESDSVHLQGGTEINARGSREQSIRTAINASAKTNPAVLVYPCKTPTQHPARSEGAALPRSTCSPINVPSKGGVLQPPRPSPWGKGWCQALEHKPSSVCPAAQRPPLDPESPSQQAAAPAHHGQGDAHISGAPQSLRSTRSCLLTESASLCRGAEINTNMCDGREKTQERDAEVPPHHGVGKVGVPVGPRPCEGVSLVSNEAAAPCSFTACQEVATVIFLSLRTASQPQACYPDTPGIKPLNSTATLISPARGNAAQTFLNEWGFIFVFKAIRCICPAAHYLPLYSRINYRKLECLCYLFAICGRIRGVVN